MRILVAYGTKRGGNEGLARAVATGLVAAGHAVDVIPATKVDALDRWDAVVVGGAPYAWFWERAARRFVKRNVEELFETQQPPLMLQLLTTLPPPTLTALPGPQPAPPPEPDPDPEPEEEDLPPAAIVGEETGAQLLVHRLLLWSCLLVGVVAVAGGVLLLLGRGIAEYLGPALILLLGVGGGNLAAALLEARRTARSELAVTVAGATLTGWLVAELVMVRSLSWLQVLFFVVGLATIAGATWLASVRGPSTSLGVNGGVRFSRSPRAESRG